MIFYADRTTRTTPRAKLDAIQKSLDAADRHGSGILAHSALIDAFVEATQLAQGVADAEAQKQGGHGPGPAQRAAADLLMSIAREIARSWEASFESVYRNAPHSLSGIDLDCDIECRELEGFSFYAVYPEAYLEAAKGLEPGPLEVIGLRSIGIGLAAMVAVGAGQTRAPISLRPFGPPFERQVDVSRHAAQLNAKATFAIVDEGPGLSGSSFCAAAAAVDHIAEPPGRTVLFPSHSGDPGSAASQAIQQRWRSLDKRVVSFEDLFLNDRNRGLGSWFSDVIGEARAIEDISGGGWAEKRAAGSHVLLNPGLERRKYLLHTGRGLYLAKFAGLGATAHGKFLRAKVLSDAGFSTQPLALRHGFLLEPWVDGAPVMECPRPALIEHVARYLSLRCTAFPARREDGASTSALAHMIRTNLQSGEAVREALSRFDLETLARRARIVAVDGRMHAWEWVVAGGKVIKTDALDHCCGHDLIGCQDICWDVAGAICEFELDQDEASSLLRCLERHGCDIHEDALRFHRLAYAAFQLAAWTGQGCAQLASDKYRSFANVAVEDLLMCRAQP